MIASAIFRTSHLTITSIVIATVAESKTVSFVGAKKVIGSGIDKGNKGSFTRVE